MSDKETFFQLTLSEHMNTLPKNSLPYLRYIQMVSELASTRESTRFLRALEAAGVDKWSGYEEAQDLLEEWENE